MAPTDAATVNVGAGTLAAMTRIALLFLVFALAGCGNKGPLVLPSPAPAALPVAPADVPVADPPLEEPAPADPAPSTSGTPAR